MPKLVIIIMLLLIIGSLASAMIYMLRGNDPKGMARALTYRIGMSVGVFVLLMVFYKLGWVTPHGINPVSP